jgi:Asp-tRNA(Asn)/Glu-tRNA(Gln) amidotransferase A subunit family amidase
VVGQDEQYIEDYYNDDIWAKANESMKNSAGLPVGIQVISYPGNEEDILCLMSQLDERIRFWEKHKSKAFY